jgi:outer membrane protein TolC
VLASLRDVEDALTALAKERSRRDSLVAAETASRRAADLADQLWTAGRTDFLAVLQAQRDLFAAQDALVQSDRRASEDLVALYKALGGGWEIEERATQGPPRGKPGARVVNVAGEKPADR